MYTITKGYKQGRAVLFYDLFDSNSNSTSERVTKEEVVKLCEDGQIKDTKIQWWEGKPIVRCADKNLPIIKISDNGEVLGQMTISTRNHHNTVDSPRQVKDTTHVVDVSDKSVVVGNMKQRRKRETAFHGLSGYDRSHLIKQHELKSSISYKNMSTIQDLFLSMADDYGLKETELYLSEFAKKIDVNKQLSGLAPQYIASIQNCANNYLMNMRNKETNELFIKYRVV